MGGFFYHKLNKNNMPLPALITAIGSQIGSNAVNGITQEIFNTGENRRNLNYYNIQRRDALSDYNRDAQYNSPVQQKQRLIEAGYSPHTIAGQAALTSSPQTRGSNIANAPRSYQVNNSTNALQLQQGLEQIKLMKLQQLKVIADTENVQADTDTKVDEYNATKPYRGDMKKYGLEQLITIVNKLAGEQQYTAQQTANAEETNKSIKTNNAIQEIERLFRSDMLKGRNALTQQQVQQLMLKNYRDKVENRYVPRNAKNASDRLQFDTDLQRQQTELLKVMPAPIRYFLEKMGGSQFVPLLLQMMLKK